MFESCWEYSSSKGYPGDYFVIYVYFASFSIPKANVQYILIQKIFKSYLCI